MKRYILTLFAVVLTCSAILSPAVAQYRVSLFVSRSPDPYIANWTTEKSTLIVTVTNTSTQPLLARLDCRLSRDGSVIASTQPAKMRTLSIPPGATQYFADDVIPTGAVSFKGNADQRVARTGMLEGGEYTICVALVDPTTYQQLTPDECKNFSITSYQAPVPIQPEDLSTVRPNVLPNFRWTPVAPFRADVHYRLVVLEELEGQTATTALQSNRPIIDERDLKITQLLWPTNYERPKEGMTYVWGVFATDDEGQPIGEPKGFGGPSSFTIRPDQRISIDAGRSGTVMPGDSVGDASPGDKSPDSLATPGLAGSVTPSTLSENGGTGASILSVVSPSQTNPPESLRPAFIWKDDSATPRTTYTVRLMQLDAETGEEKQLFEQPGITQTRLEFPPKLETLDSSHAYRWEVSAVRAPSQLSVLPASGLFAFGVCAGIPGAFTDKICIGNAFQFHDFLLSFTSGNYTWNISNLSTGLVLATGSSSTAYFTPQYTPAAPGQYTFRLTITKGTGPFACSRHFDHTAYVYPKISGITINGAAGPLSLCSGQEAYVEAGVAPANTAVYWTFSDNGGPEQNWPNPPTTPTPQNGIHTNPIVPASCTGNSVDRVYYATADYAAWNLPAPPAYLTCAFASATIHVDCPISGSLDLTAPGYTIQDHKLCSNQQPSDPNYSVPVNLTYAGNGTISGWTATASGGSADPISGTAAAVTNYHIHHSGTYTFTVSLTNGACSGHDYTYQLTVVDPPPSPTIQITTIEGVVQSPVAACSVFVCPHDDAVLHLDPTTIAPNTLYKWYFSPNHNGCPDLSTLIEPTWHLAGQGVGYIEHNANAIGPYDLPDWKNVWWVVTAEDPDGLCNAVVGTCCVINVTQPPCPPIVKIVGQNPKCADAQATLHVTPGSGPNCGPVDSWQWYQDGVPFGNSIPGISDPTLHTTEPGNYYLVAKGRCESTRSKTVTVANNTTDVTITGNCCPKQGEKVTLMAVGSSSCKGNGSYLWNTGATTQSITFLAPDVTTTYTVTYTDTCGCKATATFTVHVCK